MPWHAARSALRKIYAERVLSAEDEQITGHRILKKTKTNLMDMMRFAALCVPFPLFFRALFSLFFFLFSCEFIM